MKKHERFLLAGVLCLFFGPWLASATMQPLIAWGWFASFAGIICMLISFGTWLDSK